MARTRRQRSPSPDLEESPPCSPPRARSTSRETLVQTALAGEVGNYVSPDHQWGESFPGRQPSTTQLSLFETGFKRKSGQISLFEVGFKRRQRRASVVEPKGVCC